MKFRFVFLLLGLFVASAAFSQSAASSASATVPAKAEMSKSEQVSSDQVQSHERNLYEAVKQTNENAHASKGRTPAQTQAATSPGKSCCSKSSKAKSCGKKTEEAKVDEPNQ
jgi:hypothetical protein